MTRTVIFEGSFARVVKIDNEKNLLQFVVEASDGRDGMGTTRWSTTIPPARQQEVLCEIAAELDKEQTRVNNAIKLTPIKKK